MEVGAPAEADDEVRLELVRLPVILASVGIALGLAGAAAGTRYIGALLFGLTRIDPATYAGVAAVFVVVAALTAR